MPKKNNNKKKPDPPGKIEIQNIIKKTNERTISTNSENEESKSNVSKYQNTNDVQISPKQIKNNWLPLNENSSIKGKNIEDYNENNNNNLINNNDTNNNNFPQSTKNVRNNIFFSTAINSNNNTTNNKNNQKFYLNKKTKSSKNLSEVINESKPEQEEKKSDINSIVSLEHLNITNNVHQILHQTPLISISYKEFNSECIPFEYLNEIWASLIEKEEENIYSYVGIIQTQTDVNDKMRAILVDYLISGQGCFYQRHETLFLAVNLIDRYISHKDILRSEFQLLGISALFISCKYEELFPRNIKDFVNFTGNCAKKEEIFKMEHKIMDLVKFNLDLSLSIDFYDILATIYKFTKAEYYFGLFLLEAFLLEIKCTSYRQSIIALGGCYIILFKRGNYLWGSRELLEYYSSLYKINVDIWKEFGKIVNCANGMYYYYEKKNQVEYKEIYKLFKMDC